jgi:hypothetical protein
MSFCRFAAGKGSALVIDVGQTMASITPVVDGFVLRKGELHAFISYECIFNSNRTRVFRATKAYPCTSPPYIDLAFTSPSGH